MTIEKLNEYKKKCEKDLIFAEAKLQAITELIEEAEIENEIAKEEAQAQGVVEPIANNTMNY